jgi:hypothetical protein
MAIIGFLTNSRLLIVSVGNGNNVMNAHFFEFPGHTGTNRNNAVGSFQHFSFQIL